MAQQDINKTVNERFKWALYHKTGFGNILIANSIGDDGYKKIGRIVMDYTPPTPSLNSAEVKILNGPSKFHSSGKSSYKISFRVVFPDKIQFADFMLRISGEFSFHDENGYIYSVLVMGEPEIFYVEAGMRRVVKLNLAGVKKDTPDEVYENMFYDIETSTLKKSIDEMTEAGMIVYTTSNSYVRTFRPNAYTSRAEMAAILDRLKRHIERVVL